MKKCNFKKLFLGLIVCSLLTACGSKENTAGAPAPKVVAPTTTATTTAKTNATVAATCTSTCTAAQITAISADLIAAINGNQFPVSKIAIEKYVDNSHTSYDLPNYFNVNFENAYYANDSDFNILVNKGTISKYQRNILGTNVTSIASLKTKLVSMLNVANISSITVQTMYGHNYKTGLNSGFASAKLFVITLKDQSSFVISKDLPIHVNPVSSAKATLDNWNRVMDLEINSLQSYIMY